MTSPAIPCRNCGHPEADHRAERTYRAARILEERLGEQRPDEEPAR